MTSPLHNPPTAITPTAQILVFRPPWAMDYEEWMYGYALRPKTIKQRVEFAQWRLREWGTWDQRPSVIGAWLGTYTGWTALTYHSHLSSIYKWQVEQGLLETNPMATVRRPPTPEPKPRPLSPSQVVAVLDGTQGHLRSWMLLALLAGLRRHEIAKFRGEDIDQTSIFVDGKGGKEALLPSHPDLWHLAQEYPRKGFWFPSPVRPGETYSPDHVSGQIADRFRAVGIERGSIHRLRATFGTNLLRSGVNIRVVQKLMRHSSLAATEHYLGVDDNELVAAINMLAA